MERKVRAEKDKIETEKQQKKINDTKSWFFKKINIIGKSPAKLTKNKAKHTQRQKLQISGMKQSISLQILKTSQGQ